MSGHWCLDTIMAMWDSMFLLPNHEFYKNHILGPAEKSMNKYRIECGTMGQFNEKLVLLIEATAACYSVSSLSFVVLCF